MIRALLFIQLATYIPLAALLSSGHPRLAIAQVFLFGANTMLFWEALTG